MKTESEVVRLKGGKSLLRQSIAEYLDRLKVAGRSKETLASYGRVLFYLGDFLEKEYGINNLSEVKGYMIDRHLSGYTGILPQTRNYYIKVYRRFFEQSRLMGYIEEDPSAGLIESKIEQSDDEDVASLNEKVYSKKEISATIKSCKGKYILRDQAIITLLLGTGLRASEACSLNISHAEWIRQGHVYVQRKGGSWKWVTVAGYVSGFVDAYLETRGETNETDPLFVTSRDQRFTRQSLYKVLSKHQRRAGAKTGIHRYRHTFLTGTSKVGGIEVSQALANHSNRQTTSRYIHASTEEMQEAVNKADYAEVFSR